MSGIITGPYFRKYFNYPGPLEIGTIVAVLEIGAFSMLSLRCLARPDSNQNLSHFRRSWSSWRHHRTQRDVVHRSYYIHNRGCYSNFYYRVLEHATGTNY